MNVRFEYLYRNAAGHKYWGAVVFANPNNMAIGGIIAAAQDALVEGCYFLPSALALPNLHPACGAGEAGHYWHEAHSFTPSHEHPSDPGHRNIEAFITGLERGCRLRPRRGLRQHLKPI